MWLISRFVNPFYLFLELPQFVGQLAARMILVGNELDPLGQQWEGRGGSTFYGF